MAETDFDPEVLGVLEGFLGDPNEVVRAAAARALAHLQWPQTRPLFERLSTDDASEWVRDLARRVVRDLS